MKPNDGTRPSRLALDLHATGERETDTSSPEARAHLAALEAEKARVPAFDFVALQRRADEDNVVPLRPWRWIAPLVALAAAALLLVLPKDPPNRLKGAADLDFVLQRDGQMLPGDPNGLFREGDRIQFGYRAPYDRIILLSLDGDGRRTTYLPDEGSAGVPILPGDRHMLDASVILDDAPGPEVFVAFFGDHWDVAGAEEAAEEAWARGGLEALEALDEEREDVVILPLEKE